MKLAMQVNYAGNIRETLETVQLFEQRGLDIVFVAEAYGYDSLTLLGYLAALTSRVELGPGILPLFSRTPALIAQSAAGLDYVSQGRAILGLGASGPQVIEGWHGVSYDHPLQRTREIVEICRSVWNRDRLVHEGLYNIPFDGGTGLGKPLKLISHPVRKAIPIYLAAIGPKNVELVATVGDGWLPIFFIPEYSDAAWGEALRAGKENRSRELGALHVVAGGALAIGDLTEEIEWGLRGMLALYVGGMGARSKNFYAQLMERYGFGEVAERIQDLFLAGRKDEAARAVPRDLVAAMNFCGDKRFVEDRVRAFKDAGVDTLTVTPMGENPIEDFVTLRRIVDRVA